MEVLDKTVKRLKLTFFITLAFSIVSFIIEAILYILKSLEISENAALERWAIIITMGGIFAALKLFHPKLNDDEKQNEETARSRYVLKYNIRLSILLFVYIFNMACLYFTGTKNFMFLGFITIFAMLLCIPNKQSVESEVENKNADQ